MNDNEKGTGETNVFPMPITRSSGTGNTAPTPPYQGTASSAGTNGQVLTPTGWQDNVTNKMVFTTGGQVRNRLSFTTGGQREEPQHEKYRLYFKAGGQREEPQHEKYRMYNTIIAALPDEDFLHIPEFDSAVIGFDEVTKRLIYSVKGCVTVLMNSMSREDALEFFYTNVFGIYPDEIAPIYCFDDFPERLQL